MEPEMDGNRNLHKRYADKSFCYLRHVNILFDSAERVLKIDTTRNRVVSLLLNHASAWNLKWVSLSIEQKTAKTH